MSNTKVNILETRWLTNGELNECYILYRTVEGESMPGLDGWHFKAFAPEHSLHQFVTDWFNGEEQPMLWPQKSPNN